MGLQTLTNDPVALSGHSEFALEDQETHEELDSVLARLRAGERDPWLCVVAGELAAQIGNWSLALECFRRLDPLSVEAADLRERLEVLGPHRPLPSPPRRLVSDPGELVAQAFHDLLNPNLLLGRVGRHGIEFAGFVLVCLVGALLPDRFAAVLWAATLGAHVVWLARVGIHVRDDAWCHPAEIDTPITDMESGVRRTSWTTQGLALLAVVGPLALGFLAGLGGFLTLCAPAGLVGLLVLMSEPLHGVGWAFPFGAAPRPREWGALLFASLVICAGGFLAAFLAWTSFGAMVPHLMVAAFTWVFTNRAAGLLAHRVHLRLSAEARADCPLPGPSIPSVIQERLREREAETTSALAPTPIAR